MQVVTWTFVGQEIQTKIGVCVFVLNERQSLIVTRDIPLKYDCHHN